MVAHDAIERGLRLFLLDGLVARGRVLAAGKLDHVALLRGSACAGHLFPGGAFVSGALSQHRAQPQEDCDRNHEKDDRVKIEKAVHRALVSMLVRVLCVRFIAALCSILVSFAKR